MCEEERGECLVRSPGGYRSGQSRGFIPLAALALSLT